MATDPIFASTVSLGAALLGAAETNLRVPTQASVVVTAGASGTKIEEVVVHANTTSLTPATVAGMVYLFIYDGTTYTLYDTFLVTAVTAAPQTTAPFRLSRQYSNLTLKTGWSLRASQSLSGNASILSVLAFGGDF